MGGLGNGRRGGRSPPLLIGALIACVLVLGFNYWVSSSRNLDLQTKLYELESQVRRGVAERVVVETKKNEYEEEIQKQEEEIQKQKEQISNMESLLKKRQLEESQQKSTLQQNISSSTKTIQELKGQLNLLNDDLRQLQTKLHSCQGNINNLNNKFTSNMTFCYSQILSQKELCDERVAAVRLEVQKQQEKAVGVDLRQKEHAFAGAVETAVSHTPSLSLPKGKEEPQVLTNGIIVSKGLDDLSPPKDLSKVDSPQSVTSASAVKQGILPPPEVAVKTHHNEAESSKSLKNNLTEEKAVEVTDAHAQGTQTEDPGMEGMLIGQMKEDESPIGPKLEDTLEYEADEQVVGGADSEKEQQNKQAENIDKDMEEELADYNGDNENEGEFEADKQDELAQN